MNSEKNRVSKSIQSKQKDILFYLAELKSEECACGRWKKSGFAFCYQDYKSLPYAMQKALYQRFHDGYQEAYEEAYKWLFGI